ncbi:hypothetical protein KAJ89_01695 [Candidatus Parcubacteria bacterium]|nr:hypothetical protein [Candidatus Parcubacteria bacterium]
MPKKIRSLIIIPIWLFVMASGFFVPAKTNAQGVGIKISPVIIEDLIDPGSTETYEITVTNNSNSAKLLYVYLRDFRAEGEEGKPKLTAPGTETGFSLAAWINISAEPQEFGANESKTIPFQIAIPADAGPGGYYGAILFGTEPPRLNLDSEEKGAGMAIGQQTGALLLLQVKGDVDEEARIREFTTEKGVYGTPFDIEFIIRVENMGNVHIKPIGNIAVKNMFGAEVGNIRVNNGGSNVLPDSIRRLTENWQGESGFGRYTASIGLSFGTATRLGGQGKQTLYTEMTFWIFPWRIIIPILLSLIIVFALFILFLRLYKNKAVQKAMARAGLTNVKLVRKYQGPSPVLHLSIIISVVLVVLLIIMSGLYFLLFA